jgi:hypothetical protein
MQMGEHRISMRGRTDQIVHGEKLAFTSSRDGEGDERWVEIAVYHLDNGRWLIHRKQVSRVYHRLGNTTCVRRNHKPMGTLTPAGEMPDEPRPSSCDVCEPPWLDELDSDDQVYYEWPRDSLRTESTPAEVVRNLKTARNRDGGAGFHVVQSAPADDIIRQLAKFDPLFQECADALTVDIGRAE